MRLLLDTHAIVWWLNDDARLSPQAKSTIQAQTNECFVSAASARKLATKVRRGRWDEAAALVKDFDQIMARNRFQVLAITSLHALLAGSYKVAHQDPFDRMLVAQAQLEDAVLMTVDPELSTFGIKTLW